MQDLYYECTDTEMEESRISHKSGRETSSLASGKAALKEQLDPLFVLRSSCKRKKKRANFR